MFKNITQISFILFVFFLFSSFTTSEALKATGPAIKFEKKTHDFGKIPYTTNKDEFVTYDFIFTNSGDEPLVVENVRASCGCTTPSFTESPILPGQKGKVTVLYKNNRKGQFHKSITVITKDTNPTSTVLYIKGEVLEQSSGNPVNPKNSSAPTAN
jgi:hypothetical protein